MTGAVAKVLDRFSVAINRGDLNGVALGAVIHIQEQVIDPETGEQIGTYPDMRLRIVQVHPRFSVAETMDSVPPGPGSVVTVRIGDTVVIP